VQQSVSLKPGSERTFAPRRRPDGRAADGWVCGLDRRLNTGSVNWIDVGSGRIEHTESEPSSWNHNDTGINTDSGHGATGNYEPQHSV
jgi:hypothetical protein